MHNHVTYLQNVLAVTVHHSFTVVVKPHHSTIVRDRVAWSVCHTSKPCKNGWTDRHAVWVEDLGGPKRPCIRWGFRSPHGKGQFWGERTCQPTCHPSRRQMSSSAACAVVALPPARNEWIRRHEGCDAAFHQITLTTCLITWLCSCCLCYEVINF